MEKVRSFFLPVACFLFTAVIALYSFVAASALNGDFSGKSPQAYLFTGLTDVAVMLLGILILGAFWAFTAWRIGALRLSICASLISLMWTAVLFGYQNPRFLMGSIAALCITSAIIGKRMAKALNTNPHWSLLKSPVSWLSSVLALIACYGLMALSANGVERSTNWVIIGALLISTLIVFLPSVWMVGGTLQGVLTNTTPGGDFPRWRLPIALMPLIVLIPTICVMDYESNRIHTFSRDIVPNFVTYMSNNIVQFKPSSDIRTKMIGPNLAQIEYGFNSTGLDFKARIPLSWTTSQGFRPPVGEIETFTGTEIMTANSSTDGNKSGSRTDLDYILKSAGVSASIKNADWHRGQAGIWELRRPNRFIHDQILWETHCMINGGKFHVRILDNGYVCIMSDDSTNKRM